MKLNYILNKCGLSAAVKDTEITSVEYDSRCCTEGSLFVAVHGLVSDGHDYIETAVKNGAAAVIALENNGRVTGDSIRGIPVIYADDTRRMLSLASYVFYGEVSSRIPVIGITGTNGKTSITYMMESVLKTCGYKPGVIGTVNYRWLDNVRPAPNTTPESRDVQMLMGEMYNDGVDVIVMEVSSHGLDLGRVDHVHFKLAGFTNMTRDHLDYHIDFDNYFAAKRKLFDLLEKSVQSEKYAVLNIDDEYGKKMYDYCISKNFRTKGFSFTGKSDFSVSEKKPEVTISGVKFSMDGSNDEINLKIPGRFSLFNAVTSFALCSCLGIEDEKIKLGLESLKTVPGRFDRVNFDADFDVVVDYAHTGDALEKVLVSAGEVASNRLITVFGCGGDRDHGKRPIMGRIALENSDVTIVTSDNPRTEDPLAIIKDIEDGIRGEGREYFVIPDREKAIAEAVSIAEAGDLIVIAGKGHEDYQIIGKEKFHFDDREIAVKYMKQKVNK
ncbi:MAG: UDP-N-acetylmuramoyl-L-alanyl-D-glutamate--2,6-diaminopimelate ligase [Spirochaetes bacterium]|nr:UDP-N-acetylmuramoyl-L-alanyl-D-glutamate--2,6-diaminopimelate ligase [Spirochaetota bacterium]